MLRDCRVQGWFWWTTIAACGLSFMLALNPATASERTQQSLGRVASTSAPKLLSGSRAQRVAPRDVLKASSTPLQASDPAATASEPTLRGLRRLARSEVSAEMLVIARSIIQKHHRARPGTEVSFESGGQNYVARIERHYHPEGGPVKPWGYHPGVSLLKAR